MKESRPRLPSHRVDNARLRLMAFTEQHKDVIEEYNRLRKEVQDAYINVGMLERTLRNFVRDLGKCYND
jgi:hypothetical protein